MTKTDQARNHEAEYPPKALLEKIHQLENENEALRQKLWKYRRKPSGAISYLLLIAGFLALAWSLMYTSQVPAFIGIALIFWGALFLFIRPVQYMKTDLLSPTALPTFTAINGIIENLKYKGKGIFLPPQHSGESKSQKLFIPFENNIVVPPANNGTQEEVFSSSPQGLYLTPSGLDLADLFEDELGVDFIEVDLNFLQKSLPKLFIEGLEMVENIKMKKRGNTVRFRIWNSIYKDFCSKARKHTKNGCNSFACPLCSSIACTLARITGKPVIIARSKVSSSGEKLGIDYQIIEE